MLPVELSSVLSEALSHSSVKEQDCFVQVCMPINVKMSKQCSLSRSLWEKPAVISAVPYDYKLPLYLMTVSWRDFRTREASPDNFPLKWYPRSSSIIIGMPCHCFCSLIFSKEPNCRLQWAQDPHLNLGSPSIRSMMGHTRTYLSSGHGLFRDKQVGTLVQNFEL